MPEKPVLFFVVTAGVTLALAAYSVLLHGRRRARGLLVTIAALAILKEMAGKDGDYQMHLRGMSPLGTAAGWTVATLLSLDFARRVSLALAPSWASHIVLRVFISGIFALFLGHAIEPVAQLAGWWSWKLDHATDFPHFEPGGWVTHIQFFAAGGLIAAGMKGRRRKSALVVILFVFVVPTVLSLLLGPFSFPSQLLALVAFPGLRTDPEMIPALGTRGRARRAEWIPFVASSAVLATLLYYARRGPDPAAARYLVPMAILTLLGFVLPWLRMLVARSGRRSVEPEEPRAGRNHEAFEADRRSGEDALPDRSGGPGAGAEEA